MTVASLAHLTFLDFSFINTSEALMEQAVRIIPKVIIVAGFEHLRLTNDLLKPYFVQGQEYKVVVNLSEAETEVSITETQLLVLNGQLKATYFLMKKKVSHQKLVAVSFSKYPSKEPDYYKFHIKRTYPRDFDGLINAMRHFLGKPEP